MNQGYQVAPLFTGYNNFYLWIPLLFTGFYFFPLSMIWPHLSSLEIIASFAAYVAFIAGYIWAQKCTQQTIHYYLVGLTAISVAATAINPGTCALFPYVAFLVGYYYSYKRGVPWLMLILVSIGLSAWAFNIIELYFLLPAYIATIPNYFFGVMTRSKLQQEHEKEQSQLHNEQLATIAERERIARDLHDLLGHTLSSIVLKAELASKLGNAGKIAAALDEIEQVAQITRTTLSEVRAAVSGYKTKDINAELIKIKSLMLDKGFNVEGDISLSGLTAKAESALLLIIKEATTNIIKHSQGKNVFLSCMQQENKLNIEIINDGQTCQGHFGNGLTGIQERVAELGGQVRIEQNNGFALYLEFDQGIFQS
ncbi:sensor histidine kinase [Catenovulum agarivorans DS-2]|uniref:Sensor histidine kinase n=1 Tax=Catenovulum agarivorans DS-2 TaxID=1328313 RepID=W7QBB3_9ALTE|nr:sensor histidine kinase [Catenovulum agarivorans]EWH10069.1 sensor histidine kinase [Catenovulum agarivorans DS-2]